MINVSVRSDIDHTIELGSFSSLGRVVRYIADVAGDPMAAWWIENGTAVVTDPEQGIVYDVPLGSIKPLGQA